MNIWRIHLKADAIATVDPNEFCIRVGVVGVGWPIDISGISMPLARELYMQKAKNDYNNAINWRIALNAMIYRIKLDDLIWTRNKNGEYFIGRILSDWYYETKKDNIDADTMNIRKCEWYNVGNNVPIEVVNCLKPGRTLQASYDCNILQFSKVAFNKLSGNIIY